MDETDGAPTAESVGIASNGQALPSGSSEMARDLTGVAESRPEPEPEPEPKPEPGPEPPEISAAREAERRHLQREEDSWRPDDMQGCCCAALCCSDRCARWWAPKAYR